MNCKKCNGVLDENARFCRFCGAKVEQESSIPPVNEMAIFPEADTDSQENEPVQDSNGSSYTDNNNSSSYSGDSGSSSYSDDSYGSNYSYDNGSGMSSGINRRLIFGLLRIGIVLAIICIILAVVFWPKISSVLFAKKSAEKAMVDSQVAVLSPEESYDDYYNYEDYNSDDEYEDYYEDYYEDHYDDYYDDNHEEAEPESEPEEDYNDNYLEPDVEAEAPSDEVSDPSYETTYDNSKRLVIAYGGLRLRDQPNLSGNRIGLILDGSIITVERIENDWAYTYYDGIYGWCSCEFLFTPSSYSMTPIASAKINAYAGVEMTTDKFFNSEAVKTTVPYAQTVYIYQISGNNAFISYNNIYGWCPTDNLVYT